MSLKVTHRLLIMGALVWALLPWWGAPVFGVCWLALLVGTLRRKRDARQVFAAQRAELSNELSDAALEWVDRHALLYVWAQTAKRWARAWQLSVLLAVLLTPWFLLRAFFLGEWRDLGLLVPLVLVFIAGASARLSLSPDKVNLKQFREHKPAHDEASSVLALRAVVGKWPPRAAPDAPESNEHKGAPT